MATDSAANLSWLSRMMAGFSTVGVLILPIMVAVTFLFPDRTGWLMFDINHLGAAISTAVPLPYRIGALICEMVPTAFTLWALWSLRQLFLKYGKGDVFSAAALRYLNNVAVALFASVVVGFAMQAPISFLLTWSLGPGHRNISLSFGSADVATLFMAGVVLVIARVMVEARRVADENAKFV
ncbi:MAG: DUF2975 domain-containing protein [Alphaproteobacteria bacterium]|nr:DUF2975 domain-containing protein [Alphaproteobacteria bacterium]